MKELIHRLERLLAEKEQVLLAIDGPCASGKSTLAAVLAKVFDCNLIHMDDFFLRPEQRTAERYAEPGGNVDRERFLDEVLLPLKEGGDFSYRPYDCSTGTLSEPVLVIPKKLTVIEGSFSHHPFFGDAYDFKAFLEISQWEQKSRLAKRNPEKLQMFLDRWIPMEEAYFSAFQIREKSDLILVIDGKEEDC